LSSTASLSKKSRRIQVQSTSTTEGLNAENEEERIIETKDANKNGIFNDSSPPFPQRQFVKLKKSQSAPIDSLILNTVDNQVVEENIHSNGTNEIVDTKYGWPNLLALVKENQKVNSNTNQKKRRSTIKNKK